MTASIQAQAPRSLDITSASTPIEVVFRTIPGTSDRTLIVEVDSTPIVSWNGGTVTPVSPHVAQVSNVPNGVSISVSRTGGWTAGAHEWTVTYTDSDGSIEASGSFAIVTVTLATFTPVRGQTNVSQRPSVYASFDMSTGTPAGVDMTIDGVSAVVDGSIVRPQFEGTTGGSGTRTYAGVRPRRGFRWGSRVVVVARARARFGDAVFSDTYEYTWTVSDRPGSVSIATSGSDGLTNPVAEAVRQMAASTLRLRAVSPPLGTVLRRLLQRSTVGQLAPDSIRRTPVQLYPEDDPGAGAINTLVTGAAPLWGAFRDTFAPAEEYDAIDAAWRSGHPVEQVGALALLLLYAIEGRRAV